MMRVVYLLAGAVLAGFSASAATFTIDRNQSSVTLSGTIATQLGTIVFQEQGPGSLTTRLEGALEVDTTGGQIAIPSGTVDALTNGVWQPGPGGADGSAPADFGARGNWAFGTILGALREIVLNVNGPARTLQGNQFDASALTFTFPSNSPAKLDYNAGFAGADYRTLAGAATNNAATTGTLTGNAGARALTIMVNTRFTFSTLNDNDTVLNVQGQIVAREGSGDPTPTGPRFSDIDVINNQVRLTVDGVSGTARLQASTNLASWADKQAEVTTIDADTRQFTVAVTGAKEFYRIAQ